MKVFVEKKEKKTWADYVLMSILILISCFLLFLIEETVRALITKTTSFFSANLVKSFVYIIITVSLYLIISLLENKGKVKINEILRAFIFIYIVVMVLVFHVLGLYSNKVWNIIACNINGIMFSIIGVSIYYNYLKNANNQVKAKAFMVVLFSLAISISTSFCLELVQYLINLISHFYTITFKTVITEVLYTTAGSFVLNIIFYVSLLRDKKFINNCLIDVEK